MLEMASLAAEGGGLNYLMAATFWVFVVIGPLSRSLTQVGLGSGLRLGLGLELGLGRHLAAEQGALVSGGQDLARLRDG